MDKIKYALYHGPTDNISDKVHFHTNSTEIWQIAKGSGIFLIDGTPFPIRNSMIVLIGPLNLHCVELKKEPTPDINRMSVDYDFLEQMTVLLGLSDIILPLFNSKNGIVFSLGEPVFEKIDRLFREIAEAISFKDAIKQGRALLDIFTMLLYCIEEIPLQSPHTVESYDVFPKILEKINFNISSPDLSLDHLSRELFISKFHICKIFKKKLNQTFMEYVTSQRIAMAKVQLIQTDRKCSEIAESCGFSSFSFFSRKFQEKEGMTATQYRKQRRERQTSTEQK